jgi:hypothetical protein
MVPWPIALLTLFYGLVATVSAATLWKSAAGVIDRPLIWPIAWLTLSAGAMFGLPLSKVWGRRLAIWTSAALMVSTLAVAGTLVRIGRPGAGLLVALSSGFHVLAIRYLQRPAVKAYFGLPLIDSH